MLQRERERAREREKEREVNSKGIVVLITSCNLAKYVFKKKITARFQKYSLNKSSFVCVQRSIIQL